MSPLKYSTAFICVVFIAIGAAFGQEKIENKFGAIGGNVSFGSVSITPNVSSIAWKHSRDGVVKVIEWDKDEPKVSIPNPRFQGITTLDEKTGQITLAKLNADLAGTYILEINSKEQGLKVKLEVMAPVPKPEIIIERIKGVSDTVYLECRFSETIIWKNSTGQTLEGTKIKPRGESLTVQNTGKPENFYTCTLKNAASESTSDPVYERDLFKPSSESNAGLIAGIVIPIIIILLLLFIAFIVYQRKLSFRNGVNNSCPFIATPLSSVTCFKGDEIKGQDQKSPGANQGSDTAKESESDVSLLNKEKSPNEAAKDPDEESPARQVLDVKGAEQPRRAGESNDEVAE